MKKLKYILLANSLFILHVTVVFVIVFGWHYPALRNLNLIVVSLTLLSEIILGYCILTKWEFVLRKKLEPNLNYDSGFMSYYFYKLLKIDISAKKIKYPAIVILVIVLILNFLHF